MNKKKYIIEVINQSKHALPAYENDLAAGMKLCASLEAPITIPAKGWVMVPTGIYMALPIGFEAQVRGIRTLAVQHGITILNTPGTIDGDYRGELKVLLINHSNKPYEVIDGAPIAQLMVQKYARAAFTEGYPLLFNVDPYPEERPIMRCNVSAHSRSRHPLPHYASDFAAGLDIPAALTRPIVIEPKKWATIPTGICMELASRYEAQIRGRSGLSMRHGVTVLGGPCSHTDGVLEVRIVNYGTEAYEIKDGDRIAQFIIGKKVCIMWEEVAQISDLTKYERTVEETIGTCAVKVVNKSGNTLPIYPYSGAAGITLRAALKAPLDIPPKQRVEIGTGLHMYLPKGVEGQVRGYPELVKDGVTVFDSPSTIDAGYHGELKVWIANHNDHQHTIYNDAPIARLALKSAVQPAWKEVERLAETARGVGGFGSTGR